MKLTPEQRECVETFFRTGKTEDTFATRWPGQNIVGSSKAERAALRGALADEVRRRVGEVLLPSGVMKTTDLSSSARTVSPPPAFAPEQGLLATVGRAARRGAPDLAEGEETERNPAKWEKAEERELPRPSTIVEQAWGLCERDCVARARSRVDRNYFPTRSLAPNKECSSNGGHSLLEFGHFSLQLDLIARGANVASPGPSPCVAR